MVRAQHMYRHDTVDYSRGGLRITRIITNEQLTRLNKFRKVERSLSAQQEEPDAFERFI